MPLLIPPGYQSQTGLLNQAYGPFPYGGFTPAQVPYWQGNQFIAPHFQAPAPGLPGEGPGEGSDTGSREATETPEQRQERERREREREYWEGQQRLNAGMPGWGGLLQGTGAQNEGFGRGPDTAAGLDVNMGPSDALQDTTGGVAQGMPSLPSSRGMLGQPENMAASVEAAHAPQSYSGMVTSPDLVGIANAESTPAQAAANVGLGRPTATPAAAPAVPAFNESLSPNDVGATAGLSPATGMPATAQAELEAQATPVAGPEPNMPTDLDTHPNQAVVSPPGMAMQVHGLLNDALNAIGRAAMRGIFGAPGQPQAQQAAQQAAINAIQDQENQTAAAYSQAEQAQQEADLQAAVDADLAGAYSGPEVSPDAFGGMGEAAPGAPGGAPDPGDPGDPDYRKGGRVGNDRDGKFEKVPLMGHENEFFLRPEATRYWDKHAPGLLHMMNRMGGKMTHKKLGMLS